MNVATGCHEACNAVTIEEVTWPKYGNYMEIFIRDGKCFGDANCDQCGFIINKKNVDAVLAGEIKCG